MIPPDTYAVFELLPPKGDALVTYLESTQLWETCLCLRCLISPIGGTEWSWERWLQPLNPPPDTLPAPSLLDNPPPCPSRHLPSSALILPPLHTLVQQISVASSPFFHPPSSTYLEALVCAPVCLPSFNTCQPFWGTSYTARISFKRAPQDVIKDHHHHALWLMLH